MVAFVFFPKKFGKVTVSYECIFVSLLVQFEQLVHS